jgi:hypothetical protein
VLNKLVHLDEEEEEEIDAPLGVEDEGGFTREAAKKDVLANAMGLFDKFTGSIGAKKGMGHQL